MRSKITFAGHTRPDLDVIAPRFLFGEYGDDKMKKAAMIFLKGGDELLQQITGIVLIDRGRGEFDHHRRLNSTETSTSLVAKKLGIDQGKIVQQLIGFVQRSDLKGESLPFDLSDIVKSMQRNDDISDEEIIEIGTRILKDCIEFRRNGLQRDNLWVRKFIFEFLSEKKIVPPKFVQYLETLGNSAFQRPFDIVEILVAEKTQSEDEAKTLGRKLLELEYEDSAMFFLAQEEVEKAWKKTVKGITIFATVTGNRKFGQAARMQGAMIVIQRNSNGHTQLYFDIERIDGVVVETLISIIRLEEMLIQKKPIPKINLRRPGRIDEIPEWYYYLAPQIGNKKPGQFIFNGSRTAPDVPVSKIPLEILLYIVECGVRYQPFNWVQWKAERMAYYIQKGQRIKISKSPLFYFRAKCGNRVLILALLLRRRLQISFLFPRFLPS